jgi:hypothetical protein
VVSLNQQQVDEFNRIACDSMHILDDGTLKGIANPVRIGMADKHELSAYSVGTEVGLTFGYANQLDQFFTRAEPLKMLKIRPITQEGPLENELLLAAA